MGWTFKVPEDEEQSCVELKGIRRFTVTATSLVSSLVHGLVDVAGLRLERPQQQQPAVPRCHWTRIMIHVVLSAIGSTHDCPAWRVGCNLRLDLPD